MSKDSIFHFNTQCTCTFVRVRFVSFRFDHLPFFSSPDLIAVSSDNDNWFHYNVKFKRKLNVKNAIIIIKHKWFSSDSRWINTYPTIRWRQIKEKKCSKKFQQFCKVIALTSFHRSANIVWCQSLAKDVQIVTKLLFYIYPSNHLYKDAWIERKMKNGARILVCIWTFTIKLYGYTLNVDVCT